MPELARRKARPHGMATEANSLDIHGCVFHATNIEGYFISPNTILLVDVLK
jgi:hypothetical protein